MTSTIDFTAVAQNGTYFVGATDLDTLDAAAHEEGLLVKRASLLGCRGKPDLLERIAAVLQFPDSFGANWDALADCLGDLGWLPHADGFVLLFDHASDLRDAAEPDFDTLLGILEEACTHWKQRGTPFFALLTLPDEAFPDHPPTSM
ncbi:MAG: barstar family protein [Rhodanobacteraceae bacterium]